jgi:hypothetical protein
MIAVFRDNNGAVIFVEGGAFGALALPVSLSCEVSLNAGRAITPLFAAAVGGSASMAIEPYAISIAVRESGPGTLTLRVDVSGPAPEGQRHDPTLPDGVVFRDEQAIDERPGQTISGSAPLQGAFAYTCSKRTVATSTNAASDSIPKFVRTPTPR